MKDLTGVYARFAKEGANFHIGMVYSTQSPSTINKDLLAQTENFFVGHLSSQDETKALSRVQIAFAGIEEDILRAKTRLHADADDFTPVRYPFASPQIRSNRRRPHVGERECLMRRELACLARRHQSSATSRWCKVTG